MIKVSIFTYSGDTDVTIECVRIARMSMPDAVISVVADAADPLGIDTIAEVVVSGASYRLSHFPRGGNLNGEACVRGILQELTRDAADDDILVKIDPDTAVLHADFLSHFDDPRVMYVASGSSDDPRHPAYGCCYAMRASAAKQAHGYALHAQLQEGCAEDVEIYRIVRLVAGENAMRIIQPWSPSHQEGTWAAFNWHSQLSTAAGYAQRFDVITAGNTRAAWHPIRSRHKLMRQLRYLREARR